MIYFNQFPLPLLLLGPPHLLTYSITNLLSLSLSFSLENKEAKKKKRKKTVKKSKRNTHIHTNHIYPHTSKIYINTKLETIIHKQKTSKV